MFENLDLEQFSYAIAIILLISSIVSPIITALINNKYQLSLKKLDMYEVSKRDALSEFIKSATKCSKNHTSEDVNNYYCNLNNLYIYFSNIPDSIEDVLGHNQITDTDELTKIVQELSKQIKKL